MDKQKIEALRVECIRLINEIDDEELLERVIVIIRDIINSQETK